MESRLVDDDSESPGAHLARLIVEGHEDEFVLGVDSVWTHEALMDRVVSEFDALPETIAKLEILQVATAIGVPAVSIKSSEERKLTVADGYVFHETRLRKIFRDLAIKAMKTKGYVEPSEIFVEMGVSSMLMQARLPLGHDITFVTKQDHDLDAEKSTLIEVLSKATTDEVPIPAQLRAFAIEYAKIHCANGRFINSGSLFVPGELRARRAEELTRRLRDGAVVTEAEVRLYLDCAPQGLVKLSTGMFASQNLLDSVISFISTDIEGNGCCEVEAVLDFLATKSGDSGMNKHLRAVVDYVLVKCVDAFDVEITLMVLPNKTEFLFPAREVQQCLLGSAGAEFCTNERARAGITALAKARQQELASKAKKPSNTNSLVIVNKSKDDLENLFASHVWPRLQLYIDAVTKLRKFALGNLLLSNLLDSSSSTIKQELLAVLEQLLRLELQLGPGEEIPVEVRSDRLGAIEKTFTNGEIFLKTVSTTCSAQFGLSCLPLDKKTEKELVGKFREEWAEPTEKVSALTSWYNLVRLAMLSIYKVVIYIPCKDEMELKAMWEQLCPTIIVFPDAFTAWTSDRWSKSDWNEADPFGVDFDEFLKGCRKGK